MKESVKDISLRKDGIPMSIKYMYIYRVASKMVICFIF
jgi:hypothetical protein